MRRRSFWKGRWRSVAVVGREGCVWGAWLMELVELEVVVVGFLVGREEGRRAVSGGVGWRGEVLEEGLMDQLWDFEELHLDGRGRGRRLVE